MGEIYKNAACTIAASGAENGDLGCFFERDLSLLAPRKIPSQQGKSRYCVDPFIWWDDIKDGPLNRRGWVLQEMFLSRRILHFGKDQIFYTCHQIQACEIFPRGIPLMIDIRTGDLHYE
jgi:hypothetical protein